MVCCLFVCLLCLFVFFFCLASDIFLGNCFNLLNIKLFTFLGNKMNNIAVVYTLWGNLKKTSDMEVGQVGFHSNKEVVDNTKTEAE